MDNIHNIRENFEKLYFLARFAALLSKRYFTLVIFNVNNYT